MPDTPRPDALASFVFDLYTRASGDLAETVDAERERLGMPERPAAAPVRPEVEPAPGTAERTSTPGRLKHARRVLEALPDAHGCRTWAEIHIRLERQGDLPDRLSGDAVLRGARRALADLQPARQLDRQRPDTFVRDLRAAIPK